MRVEQRASASTIADTYQDIQDIKSTLSVNSQDAVLIQNTLKSVSSHLGCLDTTSRNTQLILRNRDKESENTMSSFKLDITKSIDKNMETATQVVKSVIDDAVAREFTTLRSFLGNKIYPSSSRGSSMEKNVVQELYHFNNNQKSNTSFQQVRQTICQCLFRTRVGDICVRFICSTTGGDFRISSITVLKITFHSRLRLLKKGGSLETRLEKLAFGSPRLTLPVIRVWNSVDEDSAIVVACIAGDLQQVMNLFQSRVASPFDRVRSYRHHRITENISLLTLVAESFWETLTVGSSYDYCRRGDHWGKPKPYFDQLLKLITLLVESGLNAGEVEWGFNSQKLQLWGIGDFAGTWDLYVTPSLLPYAEKFVRLVVDQSTIDPFSSVTSEAWSSLLWLYKAAPYQCTIASIILQQEKWVIEDSLPWIDFMNIFTYTVLALGSPSILEHDPEGILIRRVLFTLKVYKAYRSDPLELFLWHPMNRRIAFDLTVDVSDNTRRAIQNYFAVYIEVGLCPDVIKSTLLSKTFHIDFAKDLDDMRDHDDAPPIRYADILEDRFFKETTDLSMHLDLLYGAFRQCHWTENDIDDWDKEENYASLAYQLLYLEVPDKSDDPSGSEELNASFGYREISHCPWNDYLNAAYPEISSPKLIEDEQNTEEVIPRRRKRRNKYRIVMILPILLFTFLALFRYVALPFFLSLLIR